MYINNEYVHVYNIDSSHVRYVVLRTGRDVSDVIK